MRHLLLSLVFAIIAIAAQAQDPVLIMTTNKSINSQFSFGISANAANTPIQIDWGNGVKENFTIGVTTEFFGYPLLGSSVKIWGNGIASLTASSKELTELDVTRATSLTYLYIKTNQIATLDLSNCTALTFVDCSENLLTSLTLPNTPTLTAINCDNNLLASLNVSGATGITELTCTNNKLTFSTLPIKQPTWTTYTYSPQQNISLPKQTYSTNEEIDLSSQLTAGSNTSTYVWKTASGTPLVNGTDYNAVGGKFTFLKTYTVSLYCEMTNATFPSLTLKTTSISVLPTPSVIMTTTKAVGSSFSFGIGATANNTPIQVDWGNGTLASYTVGTSYSNVSGTLAGNTVKIYGLGINYLYLYNKNLTYLDVTKSTALTSLNCQSNQLTALDVSNNTGLISLSCNYNQLTTLDVTKNTALTNLDCDFNLITTLDVSKNTEITSLYCHSNLLTALDISNNTALTKLTCYSNKLTFAALPLQLPTWTIYTYSPQAKLTLPKIEYALNEEIDLSSQLTAGGNTTTYVWKTISGATLVKDVDYTESNGKFTFIKQPGDYFYCEMRNATFPELTLATENISITQTEPSITMITTTTVGSSFSFGISATANNTHIKVDWGNGALSGYTIGIGSSTISVTLTGNTIKIYGIGISSLHLNSNNLTALNVSESIALKYLRCYYNELTTLDVSNNIALQILDCSGNKLTTLDVSKNTSLTFLRCDYNQITTLDLSKNTKLTDLDCYSNLLSALDISNNTVLTKLQCYSNKLTLSSLPLQQPTWTTYSYSPQAKLTLPKTEYALNEEIDISSQLTAGGNTTSYVWKTISGATLVKDVDFTENNGKFSFLKQPGDYLYCEMKNATFPDLTLISENISIAQTVPTVTMITTTNVGNTFSFAIKSTTENNPIKVDWGNGSSTDYTIGTYTSSISGTLTGNTIKIYGVGIKCLSLYNKKLTSLDVTNSTALTSLTCESNQLTEIDVSNNTALTYLDCYSNKLTALDVTNNNALTHLDCAGNQLTTIDLSKNTALRNLICSSNLLTALDVSNNTALTSLSCSYNQLTSLDVTNNTALTELYCFSNQLTAIVVTNNTALAYLGCSSNQITALDVTNNAALTHLYCSSNLLTALDVTKNAALTKLYCDLNHLAFSTLPIKQTTWTIYNYYPQNAIALPKKQYGLTETVNLSSELTIDGNTTNYTWKTKGGATLVAGTDYNVTGGVTTFLKVQSDSVYCQMTNATFPDLTLTTTNIKVSQFPLSVDENEIAVKVYPNPANESFNLEMAEEIVRVEVYTSTGVKVYENELYNSTRVSVPLSSIPKGILLVKVFTRNGTYKSKVVKI